MNAKLEAFINSIMQAATLADLEQTILNLRELYDVEHLIYHSVNSTNQQYAVLTYKDEWVERYLEQDYARVDPVVLGCYTRFHPVDWKQLDWSGKASRNFLGEAIDEGVGNQGLSVPIRGPNGQFALFTVNHRADDVEWQKYSEKNMQDLILVAHFINQKALELERGSDELPSASLSPRETDALTLLALGMNRAQAAENLSISEHTLRVYIESARFKLGASNTTHAVARALVKGLLVV
ncbi:helix-turn-helix transcriptional regulator [Cochlodiniinecator piscidefendens]|uniref:helix-turn-helix transcriptional regulator n=1 Tax=Cochlodiniinecator piscidefendens TaxID=2715756 RepID=UPI00140ABE73|nr:LuxR family transcriptional regulator [Cochlodiniinecator piscidefendens]